jgi:hypothetical protein
LTEAKKCGKSISKCDIFMSRTEFFKGTKTARIVPPSELHNGYILSVGVSSQEVRLAIDIAEKLRSSSSFAKRFSAAQIKTRNEARQLLIERRIEIQIVHPKVHKTSSIIPDNEVSEPEFFDLTTFEACSQN